MVEMSVVYMEKYWTNTAEKPNFFVWDYFTNKYKYIITNIWRATSKVIHNARPGKWITATQRKLFLLFSLLKSLSLSLCVCITVFLRASKSVLIKMNKENLLFPPGQRLMQESGSQLNPPLTPCHHRPAPSHSAQGLVELRGRLFPHAHCQKSAWRGKDALKNKSIAVNMLFRPVWTNQEQICHLVFSCKWTLCGAEWDVWKAADSGEKRHLI